jgi:hypothetical protein
MQTPKLERLTKPEGQGRSNFIGACDSPNVKPDHNILPELGC